MPQVLFGGISDTLSRITVRKVLRTEVLFDASKSVNELGLTYRPLEETLRDTAHSVSTQAICSELVTIERFPLGFPDRLLPKTVDG